VGDLALKMRTYILRRLLLLIPVLLGITVVVFTLTRLGGDPAAMYYSHNMTLAQKALIRHSLGLDQDIITQYFSWLGQIVQGNWGVAATQGDQPVLSTIFLFFPATFELALVSMFITVPVGIYMGTLSAVRRDKPIDHTTRVLALIGVSLPIFVLALLLQYIFYFSFHLLPAVGQYDPVLFIRYSSSWHNYTNFFLIDALLNDNLTMFWDGLLHIILPAIALSLSSLALITRLMRSSMLEVMNLDYVKTARSKGLPENVVLKKHARRNALIPTTTVVGLMFGGLLGGAVLTETIFSWPGLGSWATRAMTVFDSASIMGFVLFTSIIFVLANLIVDISYVFLDPRVKLE
jgi:peptide/nickel transport system permease protein